MSNYNIHNINRLRFDLKLNNMNDKIKQILEKHGFGTTFYTESVLNDFNSAIIEICEEQKKECAKVYKLPHNQYRITNSKNIAE